MKSCLFLTALSLLWSRGRYTNLKMAQNNPLPYVFKPLLLEWKHLKRDSEKPNQINDWLDANNVAYMVNWAYLHTPLLCPHQDTRCRHTHRRLPLPDPCCHCHHTYSYHSGRSLSKRSGLSLFLGKRSGLLLLVKTERALTKDLNPKIQLFK